MVDFTQKPEYDFNDLLEIMTILRKECPWDREQTHKSIKSNFVEETYEVLDAIDSGSDANLKEELGDVLLQVVFHTEMAREGDRFDINDVTTGICEKLIRRHPHIFSDVKADTTDEVLDRWAQIKMKEKSQKSTGEVMNTIARSLPSPMYAYKVQKEAAKNGFDFENEDQAFDKLREETEELYAAVKKGDKDEIFAEGGDVLFACVNILRRFKQDPELALMNTNKKFISRYLYIEKRAKILYNKAVNDLTLDQMNILWEESKSKGM